MTEGKWGQKNKEMYFITRMYLKNKLSKMRGLTMVYWELSLLTVITSS